MNDRPLTSHRFLARFIDALLLGGFLWLFMGRDYLASFAAESLWFSWPFLLAFALTPICYEALSYWCFGATFGKWVCGLRVRPAIGTGALTGGQCLSRALAYQLNLFFSWAVVALALFRPNRTHLADWIAGTRVVSLHGVGPAKVRWFWGFVLVLLFAWAGWRQAHEVFESMAFQKSGLAFIF